MSLPIVKLKGTPFEQGLAHGEVLKEAIQHNLNLYFKRFQEELGLAPAEVLTSAGAYERAIQQRSPDYYSTMEGVAAGSGTALAEIIALNIRYELFYYAYGIADGCTSFALAPERSGAHHLLIGQNWDWIPQVKGALLHATYEDGLETLSFTEAGIVGGKIGLNSAQLGLAINGLTSTADDWQSFHTPFHVRCYNILRQRNFGAAVEVVTNETRACSANFIIAQAPDKFVDIEASPNTLHRPAPEAGISVHANHFVDPDAAGVVEPPNDEHRPQSYERHTRLSTLLGGQSTFTLEEVKTRLRDHQGHPNSVCRHPDERVSEYERYETVTSVVMDLNNLAMHVSDGPPCQNDYEVHRLGMLEPEEVRS